MLDSPRSPHDDHIQELNDRIKVLERICAESYQIISILADAAGIWDHPDVQRALDNAGKRQLVHKDLMPFIVDRP